MKKSGLGLFSRGRVLAATTLLAASASALPAQQRRPPAPKPAAQAAQPAKPEQKATWNLQVSKGTPTTYGLRAKDAPVSEIAAEFGRKLKAQVTLSPLMSKQRATVEFDALTLDAALRMIAPQVYIDYEMDGGASAEPKPLAVYLHAANETPPSMTASVKNNTEALLVEGDTEEGTDGYERNKQESPLEVSYARNQLTVRARKQPLTVVLYKIATEMGVPFDLRYESGEVVDINFQNFALDQAMRSISPSVRFYFRADLQTSQILPLRIALVAPAKT
ncbi:MAG TPA: hypothetical protein VER08_05760 [Pyrinomonadaceae bacterium]|nr:hypothetical protein [Pyrinomonadaceae bacterium]